MLFKKHSKLFFTVLFFISFIFLAGCSKKTEHPNRVVIGISSDVETINPLFAFNISEGYVNELLFISLVQHNWNSDLGEMDSSPMLAKDWQWSEDSSSITFNLRDDVKWSDGKSVTAEDVIFSLDVATDPKIESRLYGFYKNYYFDNEEHVDIKKTFEVINPYKLKIKFKPHSNPSLFDVDFPIIAKHIFEKIGRKDFQTADENFNPVSCGAYILTKWNKNQSLIFKLNKESFLAGPNSIEEIVFKIIPDYNSRLLQLQNGEIDYVEDIKPDDAVKLRKSDNIIVAPLSGREYDYIAWSNIDKEIFKKNRKILPHKLFGSKSVRQALTYSINRKEILEQFCYNFGQLSVGPIAPIFKSTYNADLTPYEFNPAKAKELLKSDGWKDKNGDGIIEKGNVVFSFDLYFPSGNPRRSFAASIIKNNLNAVGINVNLVALETGDFFSRLFDNGFEAWMAGWSIALPLDLKSFWYSDFKVAPFNFQGYINKEADRIIDRLNEKISSVEKKKLFFRFQEIIYQDQPDTFLYWIDNITAHNSSIKNVKINPLGAIQKCWEWSIEK